MTVLEPRDWDDIVDIPDPDDPLGDSIVGTGARWTEHGAAMRAYNGTLYVGIDGGWVAFGDVVAALNDLLETNGGDA